MATLKGNVRPDVVRAPDLGAVEDSLPLHLYLVLQRTPEQQADLENLIARQQQPTAPEYHKWLTPAQFGARFGASPEDIAKLTEWLESHGFQVRGVLNNASMIDFAATAGQVREAFHTQLHYVSMRGGSYPALVQDPQIPAALAPVVAGITGLNKIPAHANHTEPRSAAWDQSAHQWRIVNPTSEDMASPAYNAGGGNYNITPHDLYTIYDISPVFTVNLAANATVAVVEESDIEYGTVNSTTGAATGGDVATFRTLFGVPGTLNMHVYHGYGSVTCNDPGIDPHGNGEDVEASLDAEWINATAPSANLIFMSCDQSPNQGIWSSFAALIDNNLADVMSLSYGESEQFYTSSNYSSQDTLFSQAATQGQSILISSGDSGSDVRDQNSGNPAVSGINVSAFGSPLVTVTGGTDFSDYYDANLTSGGPPQSNYWSAHNSAYDADALSYIPETPWNDSCAGSILANFEGYSGAGFCGATEEFYKPVGGSGGISTHYAAPSWQTGILTGTSTYTNSMHAQPDISGFASSGFWGHGLIFCDSNPAVSGSPNCSSASNFGLAGGTSFVAPYMAGVFGLLRNATGSRQGVLNPALYALARAQYTAPATQTACYSNGQTSNIGVTTGLPAASCIFNDVTTGNNDVPCESGSTSCFVDSGDFLGMLSLTGSASLTVAYPSTIGFDQATGLGSINVSTMISKWNTAFTSGTTLTATPATITSSQSTTLKATVTSGTPTGYVDTPPALTGTVAFKSGTTTVGNCTLSGGTCSASVTGSTIGAGRNSVTAVFSGSGTYPSSTSNAVTVTVSGGAPSMTSPTPGALLGGPTTFTWNPGSGASNFQLYIGTTGAGSHNIYQGPDLPGTATSSASINIPSNGATLYVRLWYLEGASWLSVDYTYTELTAPAITSPSTGTLLGGPTVFTWSPGSSVSSYQIYVGTTGAGSRNVYAGPDLSSSTTSSASINIPSNGATLYVRLWYERGSTWLFQDYVYTEATAPSITSPSTSTRLGGPTRFTWSPGSGASSYQIYVGTTGAGSKNVYAGPDLSGSSTSSASINIPLNGATLNVRLWYERNGAWLFQDYVYTEATVPSISTPGPGSTISGPTTFTWTAGTGATEFQIYIGTTGAGSSNFYAGPDLSGSATSSASINIPSSGATLYVRLWYVVNSNWLYQDYTYTEQ